MKQSIFFLVASIGLLAGCSQMEQDFTDVNSLTDGDLVEKVIFEVLPIKDGDALETRASAVPAGGTVSFAWEENDMIGIYPNKGSQIYFTIEDGAGSSSATFDGGGWALKQNASYVSYYPFVADFFLSRDEIPVSFAGQKQIGTSSPFHGARYFLATEPTSSENGVLRFSYKTLNTIINVNATLPAGTYTKASLTVSEPLFVEEGTYSLDEQTIVGKTYSNTLKIDLENVTLTQEGVLPIYIMSAPVDLKNKEVTVKVISSDGQQYECVKTPSKSYEAGTRYGLTCDEMEIESQSNNVIYYTSSDKKIITPNATYAFGANIVSNEYVEGQGILTFDGNVTNIGDGAFSGCETLTSIILPETASSIGDYSFFSCIRLRSITIPEGITSVGVEAFAHCERLLGIDFPNTLTHICAGAFNGCSRLESISIPESVINIDEEAFSVCDALMSFSGKFASSDGLFLIIRNSIVAVARGSIFASNSVSIPEGVTSIEEGVVDCFSNLSNIILPNSLTSIGVRSFHMCSGLTSITIPAGVERIEMVAFANCTSLSSITVLSEIPPMGDADMFLNTNECPIFVPDSSVEAYKVAEYWNDYADRIQAINNSIIFADEGFKEYCVENFDTNGDGEISSSEAEAVTVIDVNSMEITSLQGIEHFINLNELICYSNQLTSLDLSSNTSLTKIMCQFNQLNGLDVSKCSALTSLECGVNQLSNLDVSNNTALTFLACSSNQLSSIDLGNNSALETFYCDKNHLISLDLSNNTALNRVWCYSNPLLTEIWLKTGQTISTFTYDTGVATIKYKD